MSIRRHWSIRKLSKYSHRIQEYFDPLHRSGVVLSSPYVRRFPHLWDLFHKRIHTHTPSLWLWGRLRQRPNCSHCKPTLKLNRDYFMQIISDSVYVACTHTFECLHQWNRRQSGTHINTHACTHSAKHIYRTERNRTSNCVRMGLVCRPS